MAWGAVAGAAIGVVGGMMSSDSQSSAAQGAADTSAAASRYSADIQKQMYDQTRADQTPWRNSGANALDALNYGMGLSGSGSGTGTYSGKTYDQYRAELLPKYTTTTANQNNGSSSAFNIQSVAGFKSPILAAVLGAARQAGGNTQSIDESALNAEIARLMAEDRSRNSGNADYSASGLTNGGLLKNFSMEDYVADPGYQFRMEEGTKALDRSAAARGGLLSGAQLKGITRFGQDQASQEYGNAYNRYQSNQTNQYNRLASLAGVGQTANNALQQAGQNYANGASNAIMSGAGDAATAQLMAGQARASSYQGMGNAIGSAFSNPNVSNGLSTWWNNSTSNAGDPYMGSSNAYYLN